MLGYLNRASHERSVMGLLIRHIALSSSADIRICISLAFVSFMLSSQTLAQSHIHKGYVSGTWVKHNSPYFIEGEIKIPFGKQLTIEPGVRVLFAGHYGLIVNGILEAKGVEGDSIHFTPQDTSVGWRGIRFIEAEDTSTLEYCVLKGRKTTPDELNELKESKKGVLRIPGKEGFNKRVDAFDLFGGGIAVDKSRPVISHCLISNNVAAFRGGGVVITNHSNAKILHCTISNNVAHDFGGGICCEDGSHPMIYKCRVEANVGGLGGGIYIGDYSNAAIEECTIENNVAEKRGGGIGFYTSAKPTVTRSTVSRNSAPLGGGIYVDEFYNAYREQYDKIDIRLVHVRVEHNTADYGGGIWLRDFQGELSGVTVCYNTAMIGGGIHIEHNPAYLRFSSDTLCSIYLNFAQIMGNDLFRLGGDNPMPSSIPIDTFTVQYYSALNAEPVEKFPLTIKNFKLTQANADMYVSPHGNDNNTGLSSEKPLRSLRVALLKIMADSGSPRTVYMDNGEYIFTETNDALMLAKHKHVRVKGAGLTQVILGTDRITVVTPWWITTWALIIYASTLLSVMVIIWNVRSRQMRIRSELEKKEFESQKLHEVDELKSRFFANISHEFRTPLTLILGPISKWKEQSHSEERSDEESEQPVKEQILLPRLARDQNDKSRQELHHDMSMAERNAHRLLRLINQLLDLSKLEAGAMKLRASPINIVPLVKGITYSFETSAGMRGVALNVDVDKEEIEVYCDKDMVEKILSNLLSNAFKFTAEGGSVTVTLTPVPSPAGRGVSGGRGEGVVEIKVSDTGIGIPPEQLDKVFDRFYQVDASQTREHEGSGIGLALVKELVDLYHGTIVVQSEVGRGTTFTVELPLGREHLKDEEIVEEERHPGLGSLRIPLERDEAISQMDQIASSQESTPRNDNVPIILIVEDNADVRAYIRGYLVPAYHVTEARDGEEGIRKAQETIPDLIISDVMMPKKDGYQVCKTLKLDEKTSHIPIILLTAKAASENRIEGLEIGADDYLIKPFEPKELLARIKNLIDLRRKLRERFSISVPLKPGEIAVSSIDDVFLKKVAEVVERRMGDENFSVDELGQEVGMSRSQLHRKLTALTNHSPSDFIRHMRLHRAMALLQGNAGTVAEVAYTVGYGDPSHFSRRFHEVFGVPPGEVRKGPK
jgi:signal transduction histidine kinase/DNA-binding response OmpR family regulator